MEDIVETLLPAIKKDFSKAFDKNEKILKLYEKVRDGTATYIEANEFAVETGSVLADVFKRNITMDILPDEKMYFNIVDRIVRPMLTNNYDLIAEVTGQVQESLNLQYGIGIKAIIPELNKDRIDGIVNKVSASPTYENVEWVLGEPIVNFSQSIVDDSIKANAEYQSKAGLKPKIQRTVVGKCCKWCSNLAGTYNYPNVPKDIYRRHERCRCTVDYQPDGKTKQNVWTKKITKTDNNKDFWIKKLQKERNLSEQEATDYYYKNRTWFE